MRHGGVRARTELNEIDGKGKTKQLTNVDDPGQFRSTIERGRAHWLTTSQILNVPLLVSFWVRAIV
jgi:hypothetical protein